MKEIFSQQIKRNKKEIKEFTVISPQGDRNY